MKSTLLPCLAVLLTATAALHAQVSSPDPAKAAGTHLQSELQAWRSQHGANWRMEYDNAVGFARFIYGGSAEPIFTPHEDADFLVVARDAVKQTRPLHGIDEATLVDDSVLFLPLGTIGSTDKMTVQFRQEVHGVAVDHGFVNVLMDRAGRLLSVDITGMPGVGAVSTSPSLSARRASEIASTEFVKDAGMAATSLGAPQLVIASAQVGEFRTPVLTWKVEAQFYSPTLDAAGYTYFIHASNGAVVERRDAVHHDVSGNLKTLATPGNYPDSGTNLPTPQDMVRATITSPQGNALTDASGNFNIVGATAPVVVTVRYQGTYATVNNNAGAAYTSSPNLPGSSGNNIVMNSPAAALVTAQANCFVWINKLRDWSVAIIPGNTLPNFLATANANQTSTCNAFYNGSSVNFYQAGGGCVNTAYSNVIVHEMGHWYNDRYSSGNGSDGFGEGNADVYAMYIAEDPVVGHDFCGIGCNVRTGLNTRTFCGDANPGCYGEVHADGEVLMGALWKVRAKLKLSLGNSPGAAAADLLFNSWMTTYNDGQIKTIIETHWLTLDDNDGNINNGTPHYADIDGGFKQQGFPGFPLSAVIFSNVTALPNTSNTAGPYTVNANVTAQLNPPLASVSLKYRLNGGAFQTVAMTPTGGSGYTANIPGQPCPTSVDYYLTGTDNNGLSNTYPDTAPASVLSFIVGFVTQFADNFQTNLGWTATNLGATSGLWERGVPVNDPAWAYDPISDSDGSGMCYLTQNALGNTDVDAGSVQLDSPVIDMSGGSATITYDYYLNLTGTGAIDRMLVAINNNGGVGAFTQIALHSTNGNTSWRTNTITQAQLTSFGVTLTPNMVLRFTVNDSDPQSIVEAGLDAVKVSTVTCSNCPTPTVYCSSKFNSLGCLPDIGATGTPSAGATSGFVIDCTDVLNNKPGLLFYGVSGQTSIPFQNGTLCVASPIRRTPGVTSGGTAPPALDCSGVYSIDMNAFSHGLLGGTPLPALTVAGTVVDTQWWGRDPGFSAPNNTTLSGGLEYVVCQ
jgi:hypothetical protein